MGLVGSVLVLHAYASPLQQVCPHGYVARMRPRSSKFAPCCTMRPRSSKFAVASVAMRPPSSKLKADCSAVQRLQGSTLFLCRQ